jgi:hypothetical protein
MLLSILGVAGAVLLLMRRKQPIFPAHGTQAFAQTETPVPAMSQREIVLSSLQSGRISLDAHGDVTELQDAISSQPLVPNSDLKPPPHTDLPSFAANRENAPQPQWAAAMPPAPPETPSLHNRGLPEHSELVSTEQLMAIIRQAQEGLFVIPEREQEKQTR